jgi:hypothetical protein
VIDVGQFNYPSRGDFALDHFTCYSPHLDLPSESHQSTSYPSFENTRDQAGIYLRASQPGRDSTTTQRGSLNVLGSSETISQASSSGSSPKKSKSPDLGGTSQYPETAVSALRWIEHPDENHPRRGGRKGSLPPTKRTKVSETRRIGACMLCALGKVEVLYVSHYKIILLTTLWCIGDKHGTCARCQKAYERPGLFPNFEICTRARLSDYTNTLFPRKFLIWNTT